MLRSLRIVEEVRIPVGPLALWTIIEIRWPYLADYLRAYPDAIKKGSDDDGVTLLPNRAEVKLVLEDDRGGPLTPELIRQCSGGG